ncbi:hypothetical protein [Caulobacter endophyticus]|uniref:Uncharacterized protein n=1 Tax=Caulobacter endophyticus TaxID=2172652 RepID=A0A2T9JQ82_9CAUL|nr:hypothetical protein [Caulobacter endophyticus]PVM85877.1 hypothetical protein DDF67_16920 [Caulobacter endophyticus]
MASWREIEALKQDRGAAQRLAEALFALGPEALTDWEQDFLEGVPRRLLYDDLSTLQAEKLLQIRDDVEVLSMFEGMRIASLIRRCHEARLDLEEDDEDWIVQIAQTSPTALRRRYLGRLLRCARRLGLLDA